VEGENEDAVISLMAQSYTYLMMNRPATVQFWLDAGPQADGNERLSQPLTILYVLSREWESGRLWSDVDEVRASQEALARLVSWSAPPLQKSCGSLFG